MTPADVPSRYPFQRVAEEVRAVLDEVEKAGGLMKQAAAAVGVNESEFSRKRKKARTPGRFFNLVQLGSLANWASEKLKTPLPPGWPLITRSDWQLLKAGGLLNGRPK